MKKIASEHKKQNFKLGIFSLNFKIGYISDLTFLNTQKYSKITHN